jgi:hypothetical protein
MFVNAKKREVGNELSHGEINLQHYHCKAKLKEMVEFKPPYYIYQ